MSSCANCIVDCPSCGQPELAVHMRGICRRCVSRIENSGAIERVQAAERTPQFRRALAVAQARERNGRRWAAYAPFGGD